MPIVGIYRQQLNRASETFIRNQIASLREFEPILIGYDYLGRTPASAGLVGVNASNQLRRLAYEITARDRLAERLLRKSGVSLIHAHFGFDGVYALPMSRRLGVPLITTFHGLDASLSNTSWIKRRNVPAARFLLKRKSLAGPSAKIICVSNAIRNTLLDQGYTPNRLITHYIGVPTDEISPSYDREVNTLVHVGRLVEKKGTRYLIDAFARILGHPELGRNTRMQIIGSGPLEQELRAQTQQLGVNRLVDFRGELPRSETIQELRRAAVVCVPSVTAANGDREGLPTVLLEAASTAAPIVATYHSGIPEAIIDGRSGLLVPERSSNALADALIACLTNRDFARGLGAAARRRVVDDFDITRQTRRLEQIYRTMIAEHARIRVQASTTL